MTEIPHSRLPVLGRHHDQKEAILGGLLAAVIVVLYDLVASAFDTPPTWLEGISLWASLACVWLARTENIWTMPYGIVAVLTLGWFFLDIELVAQGWLQFLYYVPIQLFGWWAWTQGGQGRTELKISRLSLAHWWVVLVVAGALWAGLWLIFDAVYEDPAYLAWDTSIVAASVIAQTLMTIKKRESWWWWTIPVNVSSIALFMRTETWAFVFLYLVFLSNSIWGWEQWRKEAIRERR